MASNFVQNIGDGGAAARRYSVFMSSVLDAATATRTDTASVATQTTMEADSPDSSTTTVDSSTPPYSSGYPGTTLATQTYSSQNNVQQTSSPESTETPLPYPQDGGQKDDDGGLSHGQLAAAIVVPIALTAILALLAFLILRRRRESRQEQARPDSSSSILFGLREKWGSLRSSASSQKDDRPEVTSPHNNSYMTGLDTSSRSTSPHRSNDEPPPYPVDITHHTQPSLSPVSPHSNHLLSPNPAFLQAGNRPDSSRSINSDAYSDTASIHSARAARMSVVLRPAGNKSGSTASHDPFDDPNTAVPSLPGDAPRRLESAGRSRHNSVESEESEIDKEFDV